MFDWDLKETIVMILIALLIILVVYDGITKSLKRNRGRRKSIENNSFLKDHVTMMEDVMIESRKLADATRVKFIVVLVLAIAVLVGYYQITKEPPILMAFIAVVILCFISTNYQIQFRNTVIEKIILKYNPSYKYYHYDGLPFEEFKSFYNNKSHYRSLDLITIEDYFEFSWIKCSSTSHGKNYDDEVIMFLGSLGKMKIPNINNEILLIAYDHLTIYPKEKNGLKRIKFEDNQFNKYFVAYATSEIDAERILDESMRNTLIMVREKLDFDMDIRLYENNLYIKLPVGDGISPSLWNGAKERKSIYIYLSVLEATLWACQKIKDNLEQK